MDTFTRSFKNAKSYSLLSLSLILFSTTSSCTRPKAEVAELEISVPQEILSQKLNSFSEVQRSVLGVLIVNVSGENMPTIYNMNEANSELGLSPTLSLPVPRGSQRLIQVLAVYMRDSGFDFYYGDTRVDVNSPVVNAPIAVSRVGSGAGSGLISGRYLTGTGTGPTGELIASFQSNASTPSMTLGRTQMINGWFSAFGLVGVNLRYTVNGLDIFGRTIDLGIETNAAGGIEGSAQVMVARFPTQGSSRIDVGNEPNPKFELEIEDPEVWAWGYFGPEVGNRKVCNYVNAAPSGNSRYFRTDLNSALCTSSDGKFVYADANNDKIPDCLRVPATPGGSDFQTVTSTLGPLSFLQGTSVGVSPARAIDRISVSGEATCTSESEFSEALFISKTHFENGKDGAAGFSVPLSFKVSGNSPDQKLIPFTPIPNASGVLLEKLQLLPGTTQALQNLKVYRVNEDLARNGGLTSFDCKIVENGLGGARVIAELSGLNAAAHEELGFDLQTSLTAAEQNSSAIIFCFSGTGATGARASVVVDGNYIRNNFTSPPTTTPPASPVATSIQINFPGTQAAKEVCIPFRVQGMIGSAEANFASGTKVYLRTTTDAQIFRNAICTDPIPTTMFPIAQWGEDFFVKIGSAFTGASFTLEVDTDNTTPLIRAVGFPVISLNNIHPKLFKFGMPQSLTRYTCHAGSVFSMRVIDSANAYVAPFDGASFDFTPTVDANITDPPFRKNLLFYSDPNCLFEIISNQMNVPSTIGAAPYFVRYTGALGSIPFPAPAINNVTPAPFKFLNSISWPNPHSVSIIDPGNFSGFQTILPSSVQVGLERYFGIRSHDSQFKTTAFPANATQISIAYDSNKVKVCEFDNYLCTAAITNGSIEPLESMKKLKIKGVALGATSITFTLKDSMGNDIGTSVHMNINVTN